MDSDDEQDLLQILNAHGKKFLTSFDSSSLLNGKRKDFPQLSRDNLKKRKLEQEQEQDTDEQEEWNGFNSPSEAEDDNHGSEDREQDDSDAEVDVSTNHKSRYPSVVVFADTSSATTSSASTSSKAQMKAFMSSKVEKLTKHIQDEQDEGERSGNEDDDLTNLQNDALLHRLVHTQILSGSLNLDLNLTPSQRRKALAGRVMEAAGEAKLGKGESTVRAAERNKAAKRVREGLVAKQKERRQNALDEAKSMGNYHPVFKRLYDADSSSKTISKKRERGLKMGVGSFSGGMLKLRQSEIASVSGDAMRGRGSFQKRGGRRR